MLTDAEARQRLLEIIDGAHTFEELRDAIVDEVAALTAPAAPKTAAIFGAALRFVTDAQPDPGTLEPVVQERFAQALSRMVDSKQALHLAALLEAGDER